MFNLGGFCFLALIAVVESVAMYNHLGVIRRPPNLQPNLINYKLMTTSALSGWLQILELHHVVLLSAPGSDVVWTLDYSPFDHAASLPKLLKGESVPAEIRLRMIQGTRMKDLENIKRKWKCVGWPDTAENCRVDDNTVVLTFEEMMARADVDNTVKTVIAQIYRKWSCSMNLYNHNCQHFSDFVSDILRKDTNIGIAIE